MKGGIRWLQKILSVGVPTVFMMSGQLPGVPAYSGDEETTRYLPGFETGIQIGMHLEQARNLVNQADYNQAQTILNGLTVTVGQISPDVPGRQQVVSTIESLKMRIVESQGLD